jgi:hypothetical protein
VGAGVLRLIGSEMGADVAESRGGEHGVHDGVRDGIPVRMTVQRGFTGPVQSGQPEIAATADGMHVGADADARHRRGAPHRRDSQEGSRAVEIARSGDLEAPLIAGHRPHRCSHALHECGVVGVLGGCRGIRRVENRAESLRGLRGRQFGTIDRLAHAIAGHPFDGVDHRKHRKHRIFAVCERVDDAREDLGRSQSPRGVMDQHALDVGPHGPQSGSHRLLRLSPPATTVTRSCRSPATARASVRASPTRSEGDDHDLRGRAANTPSSAWRRTVWVSRPNAFERR